MISIITPAYKHAEYIAFSIQSVLDQTFADWELIVINDGSPDHTAGSVRPFLVDPRIQYYEQANQGQAVARNFGVAKAKGEFIHFLDDDDVLELDALPWMMDGLKNDSSLVAVVGGVQYIDALGNSIGAEQGANRELSMMDLFAGNAFASPGQALFRKSTLLEIGLIDPSLKGVDDYDLMFRLTAKGRVRCFSRVTLHYRWHGGNASARKSQMYDPVSKVQNRYLYLVSRERRREAELVAARYLFNYAGSALLQEVLIEQKLALGDRLALLKKLWRDCIRHIFWDPKMFVFVLKSFRDILRRLS